MLIIEISSLLNNSNRELNSTIVSGKMRREENQTKLSPSRESSVILRSQFCNEKKSQDLNSKINYYYNISLSCLKELHEEIFNFLKN